METGRDHCHRNERCQPMSAVRRGRPASRVLIWGLVVLLLVAGLATGAGAHFLLNLNVRILHVDHLDDGIRVHLRTPMPYLVADKLGDPVEDGLPEPAPFTTNAMVDGQVVHFVDPEQVAADPLGLGEMVEQGFDFTAQGNRLRGQVKRGQIKSRRQRLISQPLRRRSSTERRARDSNPQPLTGRRISNAVASHSPTLQCKGRDLS